MSKSADLPPTAMIFLHVSGSPGRRRLARRRRIARTCGLRQQVETVPALPRRTIDLLRRAIAAHRLLPVARERHGPYGEQARSGPFFLRACAGPRSAAEAARAGPAL